MADRGTSAPIDFQIFWTASASNRLTYNFSEYCQTVLGENICYDFVNNDFFFSVEARY